MSSEHTHPHRKEADIEVPSTGASVEKPIEEFGDAPDGGKQAWVVATGACFIFFATLGFSNSFGVFQEYYLTHQLQDRSPDDIAWIGSLSAFLSLGAGLFGGPLFDRLGAWIIRPASLLYVFGLMMTSLCKEYWQFMLSQGVLTGVVMGFMMTPAMAAVSQYFDKKRAAALGLAICGSSIGGVVFPIVLSKMLNGSSLGFGWSVRIIAFIVLLPLGFACLFIKSRLPPRKTQFFIPHAFKEPAFDLVIASMFFMFMGMFVPIFYIPVYAVSRGMTPTLASYLLAILNAASTFGRIIPGILADKFGRLNMLTIAGITNGIVLFCMNKAENNASLIAYSIIYGFTSGTIISGGSAAFSVCCKDPRDLGTYMGMGMAIASVATLIGPPVNGVLVEQHHGFWQVSILSGTMCLVGGVVALGCKAVTPGGVWSKV